MPRTPQPSLKTAQHEEVWVTWTITDSGFHIEVWQGNKKADEHDEILNPKPQNPDDSTPMAAAVAADIFEQRYGRQPFPDEIWGTGKHWKGPTQSQKDNQAWRKRQRGAKLSNREAQAGPWNKDPESRLYVLRWLEPDGVGTFARYLSSDWLWVCQIDHARMFPKSEADEFTKRHSYPEMHSDPPKMTWVTVSQAKREAQSGPRNNQTVDVRNLKYSYGGGIPAGHPCAWLKLGQWEVTVRNFGGDAYTMDARRPCDGAYKNIQHPNTAVFVNDFINNLKINPIAKRRGQSGPWNANRKQDQEYAEMLAKGEMSGGFAIYTGNHVMIECNASDREEPIVLDEAKWEQLNTDALQVEHNCLEGLNEVGFACRDEGHSNDDSLIGTCRVKNEKAAAMLRQIVGNEPISTSRGDIQGWIPDAVLWKDVSDLGQQLLDVSVDFFGWDEHKEMLRIGQAGPWNQNPKKPVDIDQLIVEKLGPDVGLNADFCNSAWVLDAPGGELTPGDYLIDCEDGAYVILRVHDFDCRDRDVEVALFGEPELRRALNAPQPIAAILSLIGRRTAQAGPWNAGRRHKRGVECYVWAYNDPSEVGGITFENGNAFVGQFFNIQDALDAVPREAMFGLIEDPQKKVIWQGSTSEIAAAYGRFCCKHQAQSGPWNQLYDLTKDCMTELFVYELDQPHEGCVNHRSYGVPQQAVDFAKDNEARSKHDIPQGSVVICRPNGRIVYRTKGLEATAKELSEKFRKIWTAPEPFRAAQAGPWNKPPPYKGTLYGALLEAGIQTDSHESDLYFPHTQQTLNILKKFPIESANAKCFISQIEHNPWFDVPFAYLPFWEKKQRRAQAGPWNKDRELSPPERKPRDTIPQNVIDAAKALHAQGFKVMDGDESHLAWFSTGEEKKQLMDPATYQHTREWADENARGFNQTPDEYMADCQVATPEQARWMKLCDRFQQSIPEGEIFDTSNLHIISFATGPDDPRLHQAHLSNRVAQAGPWNNGPTRTFGVFHVHQGRTDWVENFKMVDSAILLTQTMETDDTWGFVLSSRGEVKYITKGHEAYVEQLLNRCKSTLVMRVKRNAQAGPWNAVDPDLRDAELGEISGTFDIYTGDNYDDASMAAQLEIPWDEEGSKIQLQKDRDQLARNLSDALNKIGLHMMSEGSESGLHGACWPRTQRALNLARELDGNPFGWNSREGSLDDIIPHDNLFRGVSELGQKLLDVSLSFSDFSPFKKKKARLSSRQGQAGPWNKKEAPTPDPNNAWPNIETPQDYKRYQAAFAKGISKLDGTFSTSSWDAEENAENPEAHFSWSRCDICDRNLGGSREHVIGWLKGATERGFPESDHWSGEACVDCIYYNNYDQLDDTLMMRLEDYQNGRKAVRLSSRHPKIEADDAKLFKSKNKHVPSNFRIDDEFGCLTHAEQLARLNPKLEYVEGWVKAPGEKWGENAHAWCQTKSGEIVDPYFEWRFGDRQKQIEYRAAKPGDDPFDRGIFDFEYENGRREAQAGPWNKPTEDTGKWNTLARTLVFESKELKNNICNQQGLAEGDPTNEIDWDRVGDTPCAFITKDGELLDFCLPDYFRGFSKGYAQISTPWSGTGQELKEEVLEMISEVWPDEDEQGNLRVGVRLSNRQGQAGPWNAGKTNAQNQVKIWKQAADSYIVELLDSNARKIASRGNHKQTIDFLIQTTDLSLQGTEDVMNYCDRYGEWVFKRRLLASKQEAAKTVLEGLRKKGDVVWFEYHCNESHDSADAELWYHSHQKCTILGIAANDGMAIPSRDERFEAGCLIAYKIQFVDGFTSSAGEDELMDDKGEFCRPNPPKPRKASSLPTPTEGNLKKGPRVEDDIYLYRLWIDGGLLEFESDGHSFWVMMISVPKDKQRQGIATRLYKSLYGIVSAVKGVVIHGTFSEDGEHLKPMLKRLQEGGQPRVIMASIRRRDAAVFDGAAVKVGDSVYGPEPTHYEALIVAADRGAFKPKVKMGTELLEYIESLPNCFDSLLKDFNATEGFLKGKEFYDRQEAADLVKQAGIPLDSTHLCSEDGETDRRIMAAVSLSNRKASEPQAVSSGRFITTDDLEKWGAGAKKNDLLERFPFLDCPALSEVAEKLNPDPKKYYAGRNLLQDALQQGCPVTEDPGLDAVAQYDGRTIKVNPERIKNASDVKIQAVLVHEVVHLLRDRLAGAKPGGEDEKPVLERDGERMALKAEAQFLMDNGLGQLEAEESVVGSLPEDLQKAARAIFDEVWAPKEAPETPVDAPEPVPAPSSQEA